MLIGFMAAGKTTVGRILADRLGWQFIDFDDVITERTGHSPGAIIRGEGEAAFRAVEREVAADLAGVRHAVLAPGGGWASNRESGSALGPDTVRVWLRVTVAEAVRRAEADGTDRPLMGEPDGRTARMERLEQDRASRYREAELVVDVDEKAPEAVAAEIVRRLGLPTGGE